MILRPPSYQREYTDHWSGDPAFVQPPDDAAERKEYERKLRICRETGDWKPLLVEGAQATGFVMGQVDRNVWRAIADRMLLHSSNPRWIGSSEGTALLFRMALVKIVGLDIDVQRRPDQRWDNTVMATPDVVNELDGIDTLIVSELGDAVFERLQGISKK